MLFVENQGILLGAIILGAVHGVEPGHGWPVAASYALEQSNKWLYGLAASLIISIGHLVSSLAMVAAFFYAKSYFQLTEVNDPITIPGGLEIGGPVSLVAGVVLIALGIREYRHGHTHTEATDWAQPHGSREGSSHDHPGGHSKPPVQADEDPTNGILDRLKQRLPFVGGHAHAHDGPTEGADRGLLAIGWFAFLLGFAHEEEFEIIALCAGSVYCLELMVAYALTVLVGIVGMTMLLIAGYQHSEERVGQFAPYLPTVSAVVLVVIGLGFVAGIL